MTFEGRGTPHDVAVWGSLDSRPSAPLFPLPSALP